MSKIGVCQVVNNLDAGGLEKVALSLIAGLDRDRFSPSLICIDGAGALFAEQQFQGVPTLVLEKSRNPLLRKLPVFDLMAMRRFVKKHRIQVLHTHNWGPLIYANAAYRLPGARPRIIFSEHNQLNRATPAQIERFAGELKRADLALLVSKDLEHKYAVHFPDIHHRQVLYNGIDGDRFALQSGDRSVLPGQPEKFTIGTAVVLSEQKGLKYLIEAARPLCQKFDDIQFAIAGDGPLRQDLEKQVADAGLSNSVHFMGFQDNIPQLASAFDVYVLPSLWEGLPLSLIEALALGKPVVATDVGGNAEIVSDGENGFIVPPKDPAALAARLEQLYHERSRLDWYSERNRARFEAEFSLSSMLRQHETIYSGA